METTNKNTARNHYKGLENISGKRYKYSAHQIKLLGRAVGTYFGVVYQLVTSVVQNTH